MGFLQASELDTPLDFAGPARLVASVWAPPPSSVVDDRPGMVDVLYNCCRFMSHGILPVSVLPAW
jgi:NADH-quinone oxidoreductase subunit F